MTTPIVAVLIKTFNRPSRLVRCVDSIQRHCRLPYRLYVADDGDITPEVAKLYEELERNGHVVRTYAEKVNVTKARNDLVSLLADERYVLRLDDDFNLAERTNLEAMVEILENRPEIGAISDIEEQVGDGKGIRSGDLSIGQGFLVVADGVLHKLKVPVENWLWSYAGNRRFSYANFTRNFLLIRREVFSSVLWDEGLVIQGEHTSFMLELQKAGWALAFTPESVHLHDESQLANLQAYKSVRNASDGRKRQQTLYQEKYGIREMRVLDVGLFARHRRLFSLVERLIRFSSTFRRGRFS